MATKLGIFNKALTEHLGERKLASLAENREPRRVLDDIWDNNLVKSCLEAGQWKFAKRTLKLTYNPDVTPAFGHRYAFDKPTDFVRLAGVYSDEFCQMPLIHYAEESGQWFASLQDIYIEFISSDAAYGSDLSLWPESFADFVSGAAALRASSRLQGNATDKNELKKDVGNLLTAALSKDAMAGPTKFLPEGGWSASRRGNSTARDRGSRGSLIG
jgi:hypothetical protein